METEYTRMRANWDKAACWDISGLAGSDQRHWLWEAEFDLHFELRLMEIFFFMLPFPNCEAISQLMNISGLGLPHL